MGFDIGINGCHFVKNYLKSGQKRLDVVNSAFQMVGNSAIKIAKAQPFENRAI